MKNIFKSLAIVAVAIFAGYNVYQSNNETEGMSDTMLANVEALASGEGSGMICRWSRVFDQFNCVYWNCVVNGSGDICTCGATKG